MEKDFHYYFVYTISKLTHMEKPEIIAYASQFVDDNNENKFSVDGEKRFYPTSIVSNGNHFYPIMTQSLSPKSLDVMIQKYVYLPFHFLPGDNTIEIDGKRNPLSTTPNSKNANILLSSALKSKNPFRIGIALHTYADTWSHQNFSALREDWNSVYPWYDIFKSIVPNIGHAEVGHNPDIISEKWTDHRLKETGRSRIDNSDRALEAIGATYQALRKITNSGPLWGDIKPDFRKLVKTSDYNTRIRGMQDLLNDNNEGNLPRYNYEDWLEKALDIKGAKITPKADFKNSHWYNFQQAAKDQFAIVTDLVKAI